VSRIFIVGSGVVGAATGRALGHAGHRVTFIDVDEARIAGLVAEGLDARAELDLDGEPESFVFLCLPTRQEGTRHHLAAVAAGAEQVGRALITADAPHTVVVRSTVPPGTTRDLVRPLIELHSGKREGTGFSVAASPHFDSRTQTQAGRHAIVAVRPSFTAIGARSERVLLALRDLLGALAPAGSQVRLFSDPATAELIKCTHSLFNATKISFWNEIWRVCDRLGLDADQVAGSVATSVEGSLNPEYGIWGGAPYGGSQLPSDTLGFLGFATEIGLPMPLLSAVVGVNSGFEQRLAAELEALSMLAAIPRGRRSEPADPADPASPASSEQEPPDGAEIPADPGPDLLITDVPLAGDAPLICQPPLLGEVAPLVGDIAGPTAGDGVRPDGPADGDLRRTRRSRRSEVPRRPWIPRQLGR
jgi:UDPglucose 6-dehydrogenase